MSITAIPLKITQERVERGWDKSDLAKAAKINHCLISRAEQGSGVSPATAKAIADALGHKVLELFQLGEGGEAT